MRSVVLTCLVLVSAYATDTDIDVIVTEAQNGPDLTDHALSNNARTCSSEFPNWPRFGCNECRLAPVDGLRKRGEREAGVG